MLQKQLQIIYDQCHRMNISSKKTLHLLKLFIYQASYMLKVYLLAYHLAKVLIHIKENYENESIDFSSTFRKFNSKFCI